MKAIVSRNGLNQYQEVPLSFLAPDGARVRVVAAGLCGTDITKLGGASLPDNHSDILGHEFVGLISEVGASVQDFAVEDFVVGIPLLPCGKCFACTSGSENLCTRGTAIGRTHKGAFAEYVDVPAANLIRIERSSFQDAFVLADPLAVCIHAINLARNSRRNSSCLIIGDGTIGCLLAWLLLKEGRDVTIKGVHPENMQVVKRMGAKVMSGGNFTGSFDEIYETVGRSQNQTLDECQLYIRPGGTIVVLGVYSQGFNYSLAARNLFIKEVRLIGANAFVVDEFKAGVEQIRTHTEELTVFLTHFVPLEEFQKALTIAVRKNGATIKVVIKP